MIKNKRILLFDTDAVYIRTAYSIGGRLADFEVEGKLLNKCVGNVYRGRVVNVLKGMQAAFVDIGLDKKAFLSVGGSWDSSDINFDSYTVPPQLDIKSGDDVLVQVVKEEKGGKGARLTQNISLPGRFLVMTPTLEFVGVSRKITDEVRREKLAQIINRHRKPGFGYIARTSSGEASLKDIVGEMQALEMQWEAIAEAYKFTKPCCPVFFEGDIIERTLRDYPPESVDVIVTNDEEVYSRIKSWTAEGNLSDANPEILLHLEQSDMLTAYGVREQINILSKRRADLMCGGYLVIDRTEALTVIDVNTGKYIGSQQLEDTIFSVNMEAADEIARQLRLRNIGGIIVIDFIDMQLSEHKEQVIARLEEAIKSDRIRCRLVGMTGLGLVELTRKKTRNDLSAYLNETCYYCKGDGELQSAYNVVANIAVYLRNVFRDINPSSVIIKCHPDVKQKMFGGLLTHECRTVWADKRIYVLDDPTIHREKFLISSSVDSVLVLPDNAQLLY